MTKKVLLGFLFISIVCVSVQAQRQRGQRYCPQCLGKGYNYKKLSPDSYKTIKTKCSYCFGVGYIGEPDKKPTIDEQYLFVYKCLSANAIPEAVNCSVCNGTGKCRPCGGSGMIVLYGNLRPCIGCSGSKCCNGCFGTGTIQHDRPLTAEERNRLEDFLRQYLATHQ